MREPRGTGAVRTAVDSFTGSQLNVDRYLAERELSDQIQLLKFTSRRFCRLLRLLCNFNKVDCYEINMGANLIIFLSFTKKLDSVLNIHFNDFGKSKTCIIVVTQ